MSDRNPASQAGQSTPKENARPIRLLIVDDSAFMRFTISKRLSETPGMQVVGVAHDGKEALALLPKFRPDVIATHHVQPALSGNHVEQSDQRRRS
jgi:two-component system chemotaxis response regulator CheB